MKIYFHQHEKNTRITPNKILVSIIMKKKKKTKDKKFGLKTFNTS